MLHAPFAPSCLAHRRGQNFAFEPSQINAVVTLAFKTRDGGRYKMMNDVEQKVLFAMEREKLGRGAAFEGRIIELKR